MGAQAQLPGMPLGGIRILASFAGSQLQPRPIDLDGTNAQMAFDSTPGSILADKLPVKKLKLTAISNVKVYWAKNTIASAASYHGILKAATGAADGSGGEVDLAADQPTYVSVFAAGACRVMVDIIYEDSGT